MGKFNTKTNNAIYQEIDNALAGGVYSMPAYFSDAVYFGAAGDSLKAFSIVNAKLGRKPASKTSATFAYPGTPPSISSNGASDGIVWEFLEQRRSLHICRSMFRFGFLKNRRRGRK
jgi:hypothetical protein